MGYWKKQHGLRGSFLEECINTSNQIYMEEGLAVVQKIPTPITPIELDKQKGVISLAYFDKKSTVDYLGNVQGIPICFDAKETKLNYFPLENIHQHQIDFMKAFNNQNGISFLILRFTKYDQTFLCPWEVLESYWKNSKKGGRKSIPYTAMNHKYIINRSGNILIHYLKALQRYIIDKDSNNMEEIING